MSAKQEILTVQTTSGFSFHVSLEAEMRMETGAKYPDKNVVKLALGGHTETFEAAKTNLGEAVTLIHSLVKKPEGDEKDARQGEKAEKRPEPTARTVNA